MSRHELTFVAADPPRASWFAIWDPSDGGLLPPDGGGLGALDSTELTAVEIGASGQHLRTIAARRLPIADAVGPLAALGRTTEASATARVFGAAVRTALGALARGRALPAVTPEGWDAWRLDPLDAADLDMVDALAAALPFVAHCTPVDDDPGLLSDPAIVVRRLFDAVADSFIRTAGAPVVHGVDPFAARSPTRVHHLRPWATAVATPHCVSNDLVIRAHPPEAVEPSGDTAPTEEGWRLVFQLRSRRDSSLCIDAADVWAADGSPLLDGVPDLELLLGLQRAVDVCPVLAPALDATRPTELVLGDSDVDELFDAIEDLTAAGVTVLWAADVAAPRIERRLVIDSPSPSGDLPSFGDLQSLLDVDWEFLLDGTALSAEDLRILAESKRAIVPLRGRWVRVGAHDRRTLDAPPPTVDAGALLAAVTDGSVLLDDGTSLGPGEIRLEGAVAELARSLLSTASQEDGVAIDLPELHAELRGYQVAGVRWMEGLASAGLGGCLADDMGLGKTIQVLALHARRGGPTLVVCPTSLLANWEREAARFVPGARVLRHHGANRARLSPRPGDLVLTTYGVVRSDAEQLAESGFDLVVADEAQNIKNPRSRSARAMRLLQGRARFALTGTPVENRLAELWAIMDWATPGLLGSQESFRLSYAVPIEREGDDRAVEELTRRIGPFLLRRRKTDPGIAPELPPKTERDVPVRLTTEQISLYRATTTEVLAAIAGERGIGRRGLVLKLLTALKQIANHPAHHLGEAGPLAGRSGKLAAADVLIDLATRAGESTLVFTQYVAMGELLVSHLRERGLDVGLLHGGLSVVARQELVDRFQERELPVLVLSLKAGGTGLNLTAATQVIHYDRWWNPAVEDQATDRAYRIGQTAPVTVHRLIAEGTVEDRVAQLLADKRDLADRVVSGEGWIGDLDDDELATLVLFGDEGAVA